MYVATVMQVFEFIKRNIKSLVPIIPYLPTFVSVAVDETCQYGQTALLKQ